MPKGRPKKKKEKLTHPPDSASPDEDSESVCSSLDGCSVVSEDGGVSVAPSGGGGAAAEEDTEEDLDFQLAQLIDQLADKNLRTRMEGVTALNKILSSKMVSEALMGRKETLLEFVTKGLKKSQGRERCALARLATLVVLQMGLDCPELSQSLHPLGAQLAQDTTLQPLDRAEVIRMLGFSTFVQASDILEVEHTMRMLEELFRKSKDELVVSAAVFSWCLLLSIAPDHSIPALFASTLPVFNKLLERVELSIRLGVGVGVALLFELARESGGEDEVMEGEESSQAFSLIEQLATESNRHTSRKDRNQTRSCFRDILLSLEDGTVPEKNMKIGHEVLPLNSWAKLCQYNAFKELLGSGMNAHLHHNDLLRDIFQMGPAPVHCLPSRESRLERKYVNAAIAKHRTQSRGKQRDKRAVV